MSERKTFTDGMVKEEFERIITEIEKFAKNLIYAPAQNFPITQTFDNGNERVTVTYYEPDNEGNILCDVMREIKTIEITVKYDES